MNRHQKKRIQKKMGATQGKSTEGERGHARPPSYLLPSINSSLCSCACIVTAFSSCFVDPLLFFYLVTTLFLCTPRIRFLVLVPVLLVHSSTTQSFHHAHLASFANSAILGPCDFLPTPFLSSRFMNTNSKRQPTWPLEPSASVRRSCSLDLHFA